MLNPVRKQATLPPAERALVICAHPHGIEAWCGGTLSLLVDRGADVRLLICSAGDKGTSDRRLTAADAAIAHVREQRAAAARLGIRAVRILDGAEGELAESPPLRETIVRHIRDFRPQLIFTHDPDYPFPPYITHRDHRVVGRVVLDAACIEAPGHLYFPEHLTAGLEPHRIEAIWMFGSAIASTAVDISATLERKIVAGLEHRSRYVDADGLRVAWRDHAASIGATFGVAAAESFTVLVPCG